MRDRNGQTFMPDFFASLVVFGVILVIFLSTWNSVLDNQIGYAQEEKIDLRATHTTAFLVTTPGFPENWEEDGVEPEIPGFATPSNILQMEKLEAFSEFDYADQRRLLQTRNFYMDIELSDGSGSSEDRLGSTPVAYIVEENAAFSDTKVLQTLNQSETDWDLYWPSDNEEGRLDSLTAENVYNYTQTGEVMFDDMVSNGTEGSHSTIISESAGLGPASVNTSELEQFVDNGGTYVHTGSDPQLLTDTFGFTEAGEGSETGVVVESGPLLNSDLNPGDTVSFESDSTAYSNPDTVYIEEDEDSGCLACRWDYGSGETYYLQSAEVDGGSEVVFQDADSVFGVLISFGKSYEDATEVYPYRRTVQVNQSGNLQQAEMRYIVWR